MNKTNLFIRLLTFPLIMIIALLPSIIAYFKFLWRWLLYGGEVISYGDLEDKKMISDIYLLLKDNHKKDRPIKNPYDTSVQRRKKK